MSFRVCNAVIERYVTTRWITRLKRHMYVRPGGDNRLRALLRSIKTQPRNNVWNAIHLALRKDLNSLVTRQSFPRTSRSSYAHLTSINMQLRNSRIVDARAALKLMLDRAWCSLARQFDGILPLTFDTEPRTRQFHLCYTGSTLDEQFASSFTNIVRCCDRADRSSPFTNDRFD